MANRFLDQLEAHQRRQLEWEAGNVERLRLFPTFPRGAGQAERLEVHAHLGYASVKEYAERMVGLSARPSSLR